MTPKKVPAHKAGQRRFFVAYAVSICSHVLLFTFLFLSATHGPEATTLAVSIQDILPEVTTAAADVPVKASQLVAPTPATETVLPALDPEVPIPPTAPSLTQPESLAVEDGGDTVPDPDSGEKEPEPTQTATAPGLVPESSQGAAREASMTSVETGALEQGKAVPGGDVAAAGDVRRGNGRVIQPADPSAELASKVGRAMEERKSYPEAARRRGAEGTVRLRLRLSADGHLISAKLDGSSGSALLDRAALDLASSVFPLDNIMRREIELLLAVRYYLPRQ